MVETFQNEQDKTSKKINFKSFTHRLEWKIQAEDEEPEDEDCEIVEENLALARLQNKGHHENTLVQVKFTKIQSTFLFLSKVAKIQSVF